MSSQVLEMDALKGVSLQEIVARVLEENRALTIWVSSEQEVVIEPRRKLKPLPVLEGYIPQGWKDAIYAE